MGIGDSKVVLNKICRNLDHSRLLLNVGQTKIEWPQRKPEADVFRVHIAGKTIPDCP